MAETCHSCKASLVEEESGDHKLFRCPQCRGIWLSDELLQQLLEESGREDRVATKLDDAEAEAQVEISNTYAPSRLARACPECSREMDNFKFQETGIWLDGCPSGHGVWLDHGELRLISERLKVKDGGEPEELVDVVSDLILGSL